MKRHRILAVTAVLAVGGFHFLTSEMASPPHAPEALPASPGRQTEPVPSPGTTAATQPVLVAAAPLHEFRDWLTRWQAASLEQKPVLAAEGAALAKVRRPAMQRLIVTRPALALEMAVRPVVRQTLPAEVVEHLEKPVSARGDYKAYFGRPQEGAVLPPDAELVLRYFETPAGESYKAHVFGEMESATSRKDVALRGYAIGREMAVAENPVRQLDRGERIAAGTVVDETCPVSATVTPISTVEEMTVEDETPVVELGGRLIRLCNGSHVRVFEESQRWASGGPGVSGYFQDAYPGTSSEAIGNFRCLYIRVTYPDQMRAPNSEGRAWEDMRNVSRFFLESSFGRLTTTTTVTPLVVMPHTKAWYLAKDDEVDGLGLVHSDARTQARLLGYDSRQYNCTIVRVNEGPRLSGVSWGGGDSVWVTWNGMDVLNHECGHSLGRNHANFWKTSDGSAIGVGSNQEYGNSFDVMGGGGGFGAHYTSKSKRDLGWLSDPYVHRPAATPAANGVYRIYAYDQPQLEEGKRYAFRTEKDSKRRFFLEYHPAIGGEWTDSVLMLLDGLGTNCGHLVDTTQLSPGGKGDGGIRVGRTFSDFESDLHFTVLGKNNTTPPSMDVVMNRGPFPGNVAPVISGFTATATNIAVNGSATFTVTASDANGDALAYHWDFCDRYVTTNTPTITRQFTSTDQMTVHVTVSDMKGGTARRSTVVTIGNPGRAVVRGSITAGGQPLAGVLVTSDTDKYCYSDTDGTYALADLSSGSRTLTASLAGYTFTAGFTNPVAAASNGTVNGANWTAESAAQVSITAADAAEGGTAGRFVISRTGDTSADLAVNVAPASGRAVKGTDYTFAPDYADAGSLESFTIPAGQSSLTVVVTAADDTTEEGPETVQLQLSVGDYQVRSGGIASLTIADNDTTLPVVKVEASDRYATETAGDAATFFVSRTGGTAAALNVTLAYGGTATRGSDYPLLGTTFTIPAGQSGAPLVVTPTDDAGIEVPEDATVTISNNAAYIVDSTASAATATITDNDLPAVSVTVLDATLNEAGRGTGTVVISRTGSLSAPLTVYYGLQGRALHGSDFVALPGQITLPAGAESVPVILTPYDDNFGEGDESITFSLTVFDNTCTLGSNFSGTLNLVDNEDPPLVTVTANSPAEPSSNGTFTFTAFGSVAGNITVHYTLSGTATAGSDYTAPSGSVTIAGTGGHQNTATVTIPVLNNSAAEDTETILLTITPNAAYSLYNDSSAVMRLKDDDTETVSVSTHSSGLAEPDDSSSFYLSRVGTAGDLTVNYTLSGTAVNGTDYTLLSGSAVIPDGATGVDVPVTPLDDTEREGTETVTLTLAAGIGYGMEVAGGTLHLNDNDLPSSLPSMGFTATSSVASEAPDSITGEYRDIPVTLPSAMTGTVTVDCVIEGGTAVGDGVDYHLADAANGNAYITGTTLTFPPGVTSRNVRLRIVSDNLLEGSETVLLRLKNLNVGGSSVRLSGSRDEHALTISDNAAAHPVPRASFLTAATTRNEADGTEPLLIAALDVPSASAASVNYTVTGTASAGSDYTLASGTLSFAAGDLFKKLPLVILPDGVAEGPETIIITLSAPAGCTLGGISTHTITLTESNAPVLSLLASTPECSEDSGSGLFTVSRTGGAAGLAVTVRYALGGTGVGGADFAALSGSVVLPANQNSVSIPVTPIADTAEEPDKTVILTITADPAYEISLENEATITILDDDAPPVVTLLSPAVTSISIPAGVGLMAQVEATRETPNGTAHPPVTWSQVSGPGTATFENPSHRITGVTFSANGSYVLRASATHGVTVSTDLAVGVGTTTVPGQQIGVTTAPGSVSESAGSFTISGAGSGLSSSGTADGFYFSAAPRSGDFDLRCRIVSITNPGGNNGSCRVGLQVRADASPGAPYLMSLHKPTGSHSRNNRNAPGSAAESSDGGTQYTFPRWVRIVRSGNNFSAFHGADGVNWTQRGSTKTIPDMGAAPLVGLAITSAEPATASTAVMDSLNFTIAGNVGPHVNAGAALSGAGPFLLDAAVTDDAQPLPVSLTSLWSQRSGPGTATFGNSSLVDTGIGFSTPGLYTVRLTATDGQVQTYDDTTINWTSLPPIEQWRQAKFGANAGNPAIAGNLADPEFDGCTNLVEYALDLNPHASSQHQLPFATLEETVIALIWRRNTAASDISIQVQTSADLETWTTVIPVNQVIGTDGGTQVIRSSISRTGQRKFVRLLVLPPP
ncbi:MAG: PKD domain-containing protein [Verrucomicrobiales bacterium]|nr:PKD domain-containing protein [Verrucomicrobiales bacterium]